jgi:hypothetical protein
VVERKFWHHLSVFKQWRIDSVDRQKQTIQGDLEQMNVGRMLGSEELLNSFGDALLEHGGFLKSLHLELVAEHSIGYIQEEAWLNFYKQFQLWGPSLKPASLDLIYAQVYSNNNKKKGISRAEFFEALLRVARAKYQDSKTTLPSAFSQLV